MLHALQERKLPRSSFELDVTMLTSKLIIVRGDIAAVAAIAFARRVEFAVR